MEKDIPCKQRSKTSRVATLITDKTDFKLKHIRRDKAGHFLLIKGTIQQEDIIIVNIYAPNVGTPTFIKQSLWDIRSQIDPNTIILGDFNTPLTPLDRSSGQKMNKDCSDLKKTIDQMDLIDTYRLFQSATPEYTFFSAGHGTFSKIHHILGHKASTSKFQRCDIIPCIFSDHNGMKLEINNRKTKSNHINTWRLNDTLLNEERIRK